MRSLYLICFVSLALVIIIIFKSVPKTTQDENENLVLLDIIKGGSKSVEYNCINKNIFCNVDLDCDDVCNSDVIYTCDAKQLQCIPKEINESSSVVESDMSKCAVNHGFENILMADEAVGLYWYCFNHLPQLFKQDDKLHSHVCSGGNFEINTEIIFPNAVDCDCPPDKTLAVRLNDVSVPRCVDKNILKYFDDYIELKG